jgi:dUTP pyrophosphatase
MAGAVTAGSGVFSDAHALGALPGEAVPRAEVLAFGGAGRVLVDMLMEHLGPGDTVPGWGVAVAVRLARGYGPLSTVREVYWAVCKACLASESPEAVARAVLALTEMNTPLAQIEGVLDGKPNAIRFRRLTPTAVLPTRATEGSAGLDIVADAFLIDFPSGRVRTGEVRLSPGESVLACSGFAVAIPPGFAGLVCPRSGLARRVGVTVLNSPGVIDSDYRGEFGALLVNLGGAHVVLKRGERVAQLVLVPCAEGHGVEVDSLPDTVRGDGGWGSTGR